MDGELKGAMLELVRFRKQLLKSRKKSLRSLAEAVATAIDDAAITLSVKDIDEFEEEERAIYGKKRKLDR